MRWPAFLSSRTALRVAVVLALAAPLAAGCSNEEASTDGAIAMTLCDGPDGSWTNLDSEPGTFRDGSGTRIDWADQAGCAVNMNYISHRFGDDHCGWQDAEFISFGLPAGAPYSGPEADPPGQDWEPLFFHNTDGVVERFAAGTTLSELPGDATDTGLRAESGRELWLSATEKELFVKQGNQIQVFIRAADDEVSCA